MTRTSPPCPDARALACAPITLSVVCAVRNAAHCIGDMLASYAAQRHPRVELIVMDGASQDGTPEIVCRTGLADTLVSEPDGGIYDAWNRALPLCRGTHVAFIGADDVLAEGALSALVEACERAAPDTTLIAGYGVLTRKRMPVGLVGEPFLPARLVHRMQIAHVLCAHALPWLRGCGGFDASFRSAGDYELLLRQRHALKVQTLPRVLAYVEDGGISRRRAWLPHQECYRARRQNGIALALTLLLACKAGLGMGLRALGLRR